MKNAVLVLIMFVGFNSAAQNSAPVSAAMSPASEITTASRPRTPSILNGNILMSSLYGNYLAPSSGNEVKLEYTRREFELYFAKAKMKNKSVSDSLDFEIAHAFSEKFFAGVGFTSERSANNSESKSNTGTDSFQSKMDGTSDPIVNIGTRIDGQNISTILSLGLSINTGDSEYESFSNSDSSDSNTKLGGSAYIPRLAIFTNDKNSALLGASLSYAIVGEKTRNYVFHESDGTLFRSKSFSTGGNLFNSSVFAETAEARIKYGGALNYFRSEEQETKSGSYKDTSSPVSLISGTAYMNIHASRTISVIPAVSYGQAFEGISSDVEQKDFYTGTVSGRFVF